MFHFALGEKTCPWFDRGRLKTCFLYFPTWVGCPKTARFWAGCTNGESRDGSWKVFPGVGLLEVLIYISDFLFEQVCL
jgi:hypothetical protein